MKSPRIKRFMEKGSTEGGKKSIPLSVEEQIGATLMLKSGEFFSVKF